MVLRTSPAHYLTSNHQLSSVYVNHKIKEADALQIQQHVTLTSVPKKITGQGQGQGHH